MLTAAALVPSPLILVPELNGASADPTEPLRRATIAAATRLGELAERWTVVGVGALEQTIGPNGRGTFAGFGVDVQVGLSAHAAGHPDPTMPVAALIAGWLRGQAAPAAVVDARILAVDSSPIYCAEFGAQLRTELDADETPRGLLIVADGATTLTAKAPGAFHPAATEFQDELNRALDQGDCSVLTQLDPVVCLELGAVGRPALQVLAAVFGDTAPSVTTYYQDAPYGVGYHVGLWVP